MMYKLILPFYNALSIGKKLKFIGLISSLIAGVIILSLLFIFQYLNEKELTVKESTVFANILAENVARPIVSENTLGISSVLASVEYNNKISQTFAFDKSWHLFGAFHKGNDFLRQRKTIPMIKENINLWHKGSFYAVVPIIYEEQEIGNLVVVASLDDFYIRMLQYAIVIVIIFLIAIYITSKFRESLQNAILQPIALLDEITTEIIKTKNLKHDIPTFNSDEIGDLAKNFKHMISELNSYHKELYKQKIALTHQANYDSLTNLPNRMLLIDRLKQSIRRSNRNGEQFALFFIDLDRFKDVNDTYGHEYGDKLLIKVAQRFSSVIREEDTLARISGDEFVIIMSNIKEFHSASVLAQKILDILEPPVKIEEKKENFISCSIGISLFPQDSTDVKELLRFADIAMYRSKHEGRGIYHYYIDEMNQEVVTRVNMQSRIRRALQEREFFIYYQPQYEILTNKIIGLEALVRWRDENGDLVLPGKFLPHAEELGMIVPINRQVMHMAMIQAKEWHNKGLYFGRLSINISIEQVEDKNFVGLIQSLLYETKCNSRWITLELTEGQIMKNPKTAIATLEQLNYMGIEIAVDDFGTGYSSLSYLKHLPISELKIDRSFIKEIPQNEDDMAIVDSIIAISKSLKLELIAEGVETQEQKDFLLLKGCTKVQGYLYGRPMPVEEIDKLLDSYISYVPASLV